MRKVREIKSEEYLGRYFLIKNKDSERYLEPIRVVKGNWTWLTNLWKTEDSHKQIGESLAQRFKHVTGSDHQKFMLARIGMYHICIIPKKSEGVISVHRTGIESLREFLGLDDKSIYISTARLDGLQLFSIVDEFDGSISIEPMESDRILGVSKLDPGALDNDDILVQQLPRSSFHKFVLEEAERFDVRPLQSSDSEEALNGLASSALPFPDGLNSPMPKFLPQKPVLLGEMYLPYVLVNPAAFRLTRSQQAEMTPYYTLRREQQWHRKDDKIYDSRERFHKSDSMELGMTEETIKELNTTLGLKTDGLSLKFVSDVVSMTLGAEFDANLKIKYSSKLNFRRAEKRSWSLTVDDKQPTRVVTWVLLDIFKLLDVSGKVVKEWTIEVLDRVEFRGFPNTIESKPDVPS